MVTKLYTEAELDALRSMPKKITNPDFSPKNSVESDYLL